MNETIQQLVEWVKTTSPVVWQAAYRQVYIDGFEYAFTSVIFVIAFFYLFSFTKKSWEDMEEGRLISGIGLGILGTVTIIFFANAIDCFANPTFQAIHALHHLVSVPH